MLGTIRINDKCRTHGYCFIRGTDGQDYYAHVSEMRGGLHIDSVVADQPVIFTPARTNRGLKANEIQPIVAQG